MRIAFILGTFPKLSETFILNQITGLIDRGHEVDIFADKPGETTIVHEDITRYRLLERTFYTPRFDLRQPTGRRTRLTSSLRACWRGRRALVGSLNAFRYGKRAGELKLLRMAMPFLGRLPYDIIHCHFGGQGLKGVMLRDIGAISGKLITTFHGRDAHVFSRVKGEDLYRDLFRQSDCLTVNTNFTAQKLRQLGCPADKIVKLPVGLDLRRFCRHPELPNPSAPVRLLTIGRLVEKKGIEYSIRAVAKIARIHPNISYRIVGEGQLRPSIEKLIAELRLTDKVTLLGARTQHEVCTLLANSDIFILASVAAADGDHEGQGLALQEAQAMGLPVVSTLHNGIPEGVLDGRSGYLVPERDADALAERLAYLVEHPKLWLEMGRAGRAFVEQHYDINKLNDRLVEIYNTLARAPTRSCAAEVQHEQG